MEARGLVVGKKIDYGAEAKQIGRAEELRDLIDFEQEEFGNMLDLAPQTSLDYYFTRLASG